MKFSPDLSALDVPGFELLLRAAGWTLARAHARLRGSAGRRDLPGRSGRFEDSIASWAVGYADQAEADHAAMVHAIRMARLPAITGV